ncbi:MAG TPA: amidohydrolase family protein [Planctomycetota bacterium]|nr:amidohydrolase family protein [Planctomycetota bacterium]
MRRALVLLLAVPLLAAAKQPPPLAIKDARIVVAPGKILERATIVFRDGLVADVGKDVTVPEDALVEDGRGLTVYPGFIDAGVAFPIEAAAPEDQRAREGLAPNLQEDPPVETPEARRRGIRSALDLAANALVDGDRRRDERKAGFTLALALPPKGYLAGQSAIFALGDAARRSSVVLHGAFLHASFEGPENERAYPHTLMGAHAHIRQAFADARRQKELEERAARHAPGPRPAFDPDLDALLPALEKKQRVAWIADSDEDVARALALGKELGLAVTIADARHAGKSAALLRREHVPVILSLAWAPKPKPATAEPDPDPKPPRGRFGGPQRGPFFVRPISVEPAPIGSRARPEKEKIDPTQEPRSIFEERERKRREEVATLGKLYSAGVLVAVSSQGLHGPAELREHLREAIKAGLPEEVALAVLTRDAARVLGVADRLGTLEKGKLAFATVLNGDLGDEKTRVRYTVIDGAKVEGEKPDEDRKLERLAGRWSFDAVAAKGELVLDAFGGKLSVRVVVADKEALATNVAFENDRVRLTIPKGVVGSEEVKVEARWVAADTLEGTATFADGARSFAAHRRVER